MAKRFFCFGLGYSASVLGRQLLAAGWRVGGTCQDEARAEALRVEGIEAVVFDGARPMGDVKTALRGTTHLLVSIPPGADGDPVLRHHGSDIAAVEGLEWIGYLSTTGVYGDRQGGCVDETAARTPSSERNRRRVAAEDGWLALGREHGIPAHLFRLAGIYGPGRSVLDKVRAGKARRIVKPGHRFSRIHVKDIAQVVRASMDRSDPGAAYNLCDDEAAPPAEVTAFACELLGVEPPPEVPFEEASKSMTPMGLTFWQDDRLVDNAKIKTALGVKLLYPTYREGLRAILKAGG